MSLAAIGYHFGSKEQLITEALTDALDTAIGDSMGELIREGQPPAHRRVRAPLERHARRLRGQPRRAAREPREHAAHRA
ncbi:hypothetical protein NKG05_06700 [Oerskovia sp. M15]